MAVRPRTFDVVERTQSGIKYLDTLVMLDNPNTDWWMPMSHVTVSVFNAAGKIIGTESNVIAIGPGEKAAFDATVNIGSEVYDKVQVDLSQDELRTSPS